MLFLLLAELHISWDSGHGLISSPCVTHSSFSPDIWRAGCSGRSLEVLSARSPHHDKRGATSGGQEGPGLAVGSGAPSVRPPQRLAVWTKGLARGQPRELPVVKARSLAGSRAELSCIPAVSLPRLVDLDWRVDIKTSSDSISRMAVPTCLLQMKVWPPSCSLAGRGQGHAGSWCPTDQRKGQSPKS